MTFAGAGSAALFTLFVWWFSTGAILWLNRRGRATYAWSLAAAAVLGAASLFGVAATMKSATPESAVLAFSCALVLWGCHELSFLLGAVTGPSAEPCPSGAAGWRRFRLAASTLIYHEAALAATAAALAAVTVGQPNQVASWTFLTLAICRLSAQFNLFLGVPNFSAEFFPAHLRHLTTYLKKGPANPLFRICVAAGLGLAGFEAWRAFDPQAGAFQVTAFSLLFTLTGLAVLEHLFMVMPVPDAALWRWALPASEKKPTSVSVDA
jgi:putative photosynthetic complex assembly protein 2